MVDLFSDFKEYSVVTRVFLLVLMFIPAVVNYFALKTFQDAILATACTILLGYGIPLLLIRFFVDKYMPSRAYPGEGGDFEGFTRKGILHGIVWGVIIGFGLILYCTFINWGPKSIVLPMPAYSGNHFYFYWTGFFIIWVLILPIIEDIFWICQFSSWDQFGSDLLISALYALMNFSWLYQVVEPYHSVIILTVASFCICYLCVKLRKDGSSLLLHGLRTGFGLGIFILLVYLNSTNESYKSPRYYQRASSSNKWVKWTS